MCICFTHCLLLIIAMHLFLHKPSHVLLTLLLLHVQCNGSNDSIVPAVIVFGDSVVDTGNNNNLKTIFKVNYPPYGQDFSGGQPTGRFSNGKVPSDFLVEELGVKDVLPPYLDPNLKNEDLLTGVNFASGGGGYDPLTSVLASVISLDEQIELFKEYKEKVKSVAGEEVLNTILSKGLFVVATGSNDVTNTYFNNPLRLYHYDFDSYTHLMVDSASSFLQNLYNLGARRIGVFGIPPIGCLPSQRTLKGGTLRECAEKNNELAALFNTKLSMEINYLNLNLPSARMVYIDGYYLPLDIIQNPTKYGFDVSTVGCCGTGTIEVAFLCKYTCSNVSEYVFWDSFHFTENAYKIIVHDFLSKNMNLMM
ncbi:GDSL esterase/lipase EXL3 [Helianthus annuus]|nr:GDSL esterase/lipase EXL3 [Helianthus annuus]